MGRRLGSREVALVQLARPGEREPRSAGARGFRRDRSTEKRPSLEPRRQGARSPRGARQEGVYRQERLELERGGNVPHGTASAPPPQRGLEASPQALVRRPSGSDRPAIPPSLLDSRPVRRT